MRWGRGSRGNQVAVVSQYYCTGREALEGVCRQGVEQRFVVKDLVSSCACKYTLVFEFSKLVTGWRKSYLHAAMITTDFRPAAAIALHAVPWRVSCT